MTPTSSSSDFSERWRYFFRILERRVWTILTFFVLTLFLVMGGTLLQPRLYRANASVLVDMETPRVLAVSTSRDESTVGQSHYQTYADYYRTQLEIIKSRAVAQQVFTNLKLHDEDRYKKSKDPVGKLLKQIEVEPIKQTRLARIYAEDPHPKQAARIANEFALVFAQENLEKVASNETLTLMKNEYLKLQSKEAELSKRYKDKFPAVIRVRKQMEELTREIEREIKRQLYAETSLVEGLPQEGESKSFLERFQDDSLLSGLRPNNIRVQDFAKAPTKPAKPNVKLNFLLALFLGLLGGLGSGVIEELLDNTLKVPADVQGDSRSLLLGHIPRFDGLAFKFDKKALRQHYQYVHFEPHSQAAEAYRSLRTNLIYTIPQAQNDALVVTSPASEEGKTTTLTNLGIALGHIGLKTLLVDADLRKPRLHEVFHLRHKPGLSEYLEGQASLEEIIQASKIPGVSVVTSGNHPSNPSELLGSPPMKKFLEKVTAEFDRVLVDTPPMMAVTDAMILAATTGTVLAVVQSEKTPRQALDRLIAMVNDVKARVVGVVLNNVPTRYVNAYYGYSYYPYGSHESQNGGTPFQSFVDLLKRLTTRHHPDFHSSEKEKREHHLTTEKDAERR